ILKRESNHSVFPIPIWIIVIYLTLIILITFTSFLPPASGQLDYYIPYVVSVAAILLGGFVWWLRSKDLEDSNSPEDQKSSEDPDGPEIPK
ncbi:6782_t:CDS:1, partial [Racocetra persica]